MRKIAFAVLFTFLVMLTGCGKTAPLKIGVIQYGEHPALDLAYEGFLDGLKTEGFVNGENFAIDYGNAQSDGTKCESIATRLVAEQNNLILAIATPAAQAVARKTKSIPILVTAVTDPQSAGLVRSNDYPQTNVSGTSDLTPCAKQIDLVTKLVPTTKTIGLLYSSGEENSCYQADLAKRACSERGLSFIDATVSDKNEVQEAVQSLVGKVDAIYTPTDNLIASCMETISMIASENKLPVIVGEEGMVQGGGLATYGINYYELGRKTAEMAIEIIRNGRQIQNMPVQYLDSYEFSYNKYTAAELGITIPSDIQ